MVPEDRCLTAGRDRTFDVPVDEDASGAVAGVPSVKMFWSYVRKCVQSDATAVDPAPQTLGLRASKVALAMLIAMVWAVSLLR